MIFAPLAGAARLNEEARDFKHMRITPRPYISSLDTHRPAACTFTVWHVSEQACYVSIAACNTDIVTLSWTSPYQRFGYVAIVRLSQPGRCLDISPRPLGLVAYLSQVANDFIDK